MAVAHEIVEILSMGREGVGFELRAITIRLAGVAFVAQIATPSVILKNHDHLRCIAYCGDFLSIGIVRGRVEGCAG